jgi:pimeloyl-ACP methyl ester carboxylesterase
MNDSRLRTVPTLVGALALGVLLPLSTANAQPRIVSQEASTIKGRVGARYEAVTYRIEVPEKRSNPDSKPIQLAVLQIKSPNPQADKPIFCLAGGPGGSSIQMVRESLFFDPELIEMGDLVGVDQRGIGKSTPRLIYEDIEYDVPYDQPGDPDALLAIVSAAHKKAYARLMELGINPAGYNTEESADDIDDVRKLLGYDTVRVIGGSYGSHLAFSLTRRHGDSIERVVIQSPEGPDHTFKRPGQIQEGLELLAARVAQDEKISSQVPDLLAMTETVLDRLEQEPVYVQVPVPKTDRQQTVGISKFDVQRWIAGSLGRNGSARNVPRVVYEMAHGDFSTIGESFYRRRGTRKGVHAMASLVDTASWATDERFKTIEREAAAALLGDAIDFPSYRLADAWGRHFLDDAFRGPLESDVPYLFIVGDLDARTPPSNAREILAGLPNGHLITVVNGAHDFSILINREARALVHAFLKGEPISQTEIVAPVVGFVPIETR